MKDENFDVRINFADLLIILGCLREAAYNSTSDIYVRVGAENILKLREVYDRFDKIVDEKIKF